MTAERIIELLGLEPHGMEGGFYRETWRCGRLIPGEGAKDKYPGGRACGTAIYFLITPESFSALHRLPGDEVFHFYDGDPAEMLKIFPDGRAERLILGNDLEQGHRPQCIVPGGVWQGIRLRNGGRFTLLGTTMAPGFDFADYDSGDRGTLIRMYPPLEHLIRDYTTG